ncbi:MAG: response regulator [Hyphomonas sp.]|nr:response regulator [Hyphomonas sp.]
MPTESERLRRRLEREKRAREEAERLLEAKSGELFDAAEQLRVQTTRARALAAAIEAASDGIALTDEAGVFTYMNAAHANMFGYTADELIGQPWAKLYTPAVTAMIEKDIMPGVFSSGGWRGELEGRARSGTSVAQEVVLSLRADGGLVCATRDISKRLARERETSELEARLLKAERQAALFTMGNAMAHDFNNLIAAISGYAILLKSELQEGSAQHQRVGRILEASEQAFDIVRSLEASRTEDVQKVSDIDLVQLLHTSLAITEGIRPSGIRINVDMPATARVRSNEVLLSRALVNITKNAFEAMQPEGTLSVRLGKEATAPFHGKAQRLRFGDQPGTPDFVMEIIDTGPGIPPDMLEAVFNPFTTTKAAKHESGLGLLSVKALADMKFASIELDTLPDAGTCIRILFFPRAQGLAAEAASLPFATVRPDGQIHVLVVDDDPSLGEVIVEILSRQGFTADLETNPLEALERIRSDAFHHDILVTDLTMPELSGDLLAQSVKQARPDLPVILYSGQGGYVPRDAIFADILTKPIPPERLKASIEQALHRRSLHDGNGP